MIGFILTGHGHFSTGLKSAVDMIAGPQDNFEAVPFEEEKAGEYAGTIFLTVRTTKLTIWRFGNGNRSPTLVVTISLQAVPGSAFSSVLAKF